MKLKQKISADYLQAFKQRDNVKKNILSVIKGEIQTIEKNNNIEELPDNEVEKILRKIEKSTKETINKITQTKDSDLLSQSTAELLIIQEYLPAQLNESETTNIVKKIIDSGNYNIGLIMKELSSFNVDKQLASSIANKLLNNRN